MERTSRLVRLDPRTGDLLWQAAISDVWGDLALGPDVCVYLDGQGTMYAVELGSGRVLWAEPERLYQRQLCVAGRVVISGAWRGYRPMQAYDLDSGTRLWSDSEPLGAGTHRPVVFPAARGPSLGYRPHHLSLVDVAAGTCTTLPTVEGPVHGAVLPVGSGAAVVDTGGWLRIYDQTGQLLNHCRPTPRASDMQSAAPGLAHVSAKGSILAVRLDERTLGRNPKP